VATGGLRKRVSIDAGVGSEVGHALVLRARILVAPGVRRAPQIVAKAAPRPGARSLESDFFGSHAGTVYEDLGPHYFDTRDHLKLVRRLVRRLSDLGVQVELKGAA